MFNNLNEIFKFHNLNNDNTNNCYFFVYFRFNTVDWVKVRIFLKKYNFQIQLIPIEKICSFKLFNKIFITYNKSTLLFFFPDILYINFFKPIDVFCTINSLYINNKLYYFPYLNIFISNSIINKLVKLKIVFNFLLNYFIWIIDLIFYFIKQLFFFYINFITFLNYLFYYNNFFFKYF